MNLLESIVSKHVDETIDRLILAITEVQNRLGHDFATLRELSAVIRRFDYDTKATIDHFENALSRGKQYDKGKQDDKEKQDDKGKQEYDSEEKNEEESYARKFEYQEREGQVEKQRLEEELTMRFLKDESERKQKELDKKTYECDICLSEITIEQLYILEECFHRYCKDCIADHCLSGINNGKVRRITCPSPDCKHILSYQEIRQLISQEVFDRYETFLLRETLADDPDSVWCARPGCSMAMIANGGMMMTCPSESCAFSFCRSCKEPWHADSTCEQHKQWKIDNGQADNLYENWARENTKNCPSCLRPIQKNGGCNHMTCSHCRHEFCWVCLVDFDDDSQEYHDDCEDES
jgi:hypothetical protein